MVPAVIGLLIDAIGASITLADRAMTYLEDVFHLRPAPYPAVVDETPPAGAGAASAGTCAGTGGHLNDDERESTSDLLTFAAEEIRALGLMAFIRPQPWVEGFAAELRERAKDLASQGD